MTVKVLDQATLVMLTVSWAYTLNLWRPTWLIKPDSKRNCFSTKSIDFITEGAVGVPSLKEMGTMLYYSSLQSVAVNSYKAPKSYAGSRLRPEKFSIVEAVI